MKRVIVLYCVIPLSVFGQKIENLTAKASGDQIVITFDLPEGESGSHYSVAVFSSHNNFSSPLRNVSGDVGSTVLPGRNKRVEWAAKTELGKFKGELSFEIRAELILPLTLTSRITSARRGARLDLQWKGGRQDDDISIVLRDHNKTVLFSETAPNTRRYTWSVPPDLKPGSRYELQITAGKDAVTVTPFSIRRRIPTALKVLPLLGIGAVYYLFLAPINGEKVENLPGPPEMGLD